MVLTSLATDGEEEGGGGSAQAEADAEAAALQELKMGRGD